MIKILLILSILIFSACTSVKDSLTLKKKSSADEFLVEKKNPLVMPPDYGKLPQPGTGDSIQNIEKKDTSGEVEKLLTNKDKSSTKSQNKKSSTIEKLILEKIK
jgi:hypothetical protein